MKNITRLLIFLVALPLTQSCGNLPAYVKPFSLAVIDTGVVDYRYVDPRNGHFLYHFFPEKCLIDTAETVGDSGAGNSVADIPGCDRTVAADDQVRANDSVSINLLYGYICDFSEDANDWSELDKHYGDDQEVTPCFGDEARAGVRGEITVLATVFELDGEKKISWTQGEVGDESARVVYYNDDVREAGQPLNLSNLPMYGPISYNGKPVFLRMAAVELDQKEAAETGAILRSLASLGAKAYPPASPVLSALDRVGGAFLESQQDDLFWQYEMLFDGDGGIAPVTAPLTAGIISFVRVQNRSKQFEWDKYCVDKTTGIIHKKPKASYGTEETEETICDSEDPLTGHTYFTIQIKRNESALNQDAFQKFSELNDISSEEAAMPESLTEFFSEAENELTKTAVFDRARSLSVDLNSESQVRRIKSREAFHSALCLGYGDEESSEEDKRLSQDQRFKLLEWLEQAWAEGQSEAQGEEEVDEEVDGSGFDATAFVGSEEGINAECAKSISEWSALFNTG